MSTTKKTQAAKPAESSTKPTATGASLVPNFDNPTAGVSERLWFWVGTFPTIDRAEVTIGGTSFVRTHETVKDRGESSRSVRVPYIGQLMHLSRAQVEAIKDRLRFSMFRFTEAPRDILTVGEPIEALEQKPRRGHPVRIMTDEEMKVRRASMLSTPGYDRQKWDEPLADHVFAVLCKNQERPRVGVEYPDPLSVTGLEWPD